MANIFSTFTNSIVPENKVVATIETPEGPLVLTAEMANHLDDYPQWKEMLEDMAQTVEQTT